MPETTPTNSEIADVLERIADILETQDANPFRVRAYRSGARSIRAAEDSVANYVRQGKTEELDKIPNIGGGLAAVITEFVTTGRSSLLDQLEGQASPEAIFMRVPGIGHELAQRIVDNLHIETLEELEQAAYDGRLETVEGFGPRRVKAVRASLADLLSRSASRRRVAAETGDGQREREKEPSVDLLLEVDAEYRRRAEAGELRKIAPKRFNPDGEAWLPMMEMKRDGWSFTVLYSNTARAHELGKTHDWVVIYFERDGKESQCTVVTATSGPLKGKRVVRGREKETRKHYEAAQPV
jgi:hypothetical protein